MTISLIEAMVVLPEHLHCIWRLPEGDDDYPLRWRLLKSHFSRQIEKGETVSDSRLRKSERGIYPMGTSGNGDTGNTKSVTKRIISDI